MPRTELPGAAETPCTTGAILQSKCCHSIVHLQSVRPWTDDALASERRVAHETAKGDKGTLTVYPLRPLVA
eukprot:CAMPEP_0168368876 /NCGR_PEP_ID=MMETSP0228-20121227/6473_1 /TAXON_ID=133427 /ORGANISM="Protoceratium reticulatum, Strain CCCM 535 (=CCMP 1889)" /LENGTH=70 /DNA_ID=CAMNT_0008381729 /DNA_START=23 /DNA_END=231 /DNA_ORIENTATION=-